MGEVSRQFASLFHNMRYSQDATAEAALPESLRGPTRRAETKELNHREAAPVGKMKGNFESWVPLKRTPFPYFTTW